MLPNHPWNLSRAVNVTAVELIHVQWKSESTRYVIFFMSIYDVGKTNASTAVATEVHHCGLSRPVRPNNKGER